MNNRELMLGDIHTMRGWSGGALPAGVKESSTANVLLKRLYGHGETGETITATRKKRKLPFFRGEYDVYTKTGVELNPDGQKYRSGKAAVRAGFKKL